MNQQVSTVDNPFSTGKSVQEAAGNALSSAEEQRAIQEVQAAMVIAKKFPRNSIEAMDRIINACCRPTLAETALYQYPRGGQNVTGPSIRLAEALAQEWGNMQFGIRELSQANGVSTVEAFAWDVETNTRQVKVFQVPHVRGTRQGVKKLTDPRDIYEMIANQGARRLRACILGVIPGDVTEKAVEQCAVTQQANIEVTPETIKSIVSYFSETHGVSPELIEKRIGRRVEAINAPIMLNLRKIAQALKDGMSKPSDWFDMDDTTEAVAPTSSLNDEVRQQASVPAVPAPSAEVAPPAAQVEQAETGRQPESVEPPHSGESTQPMLTFAQVADAVQKAGSTDAIEALGNSMIPDFLMTVPKPEQREEFRQNLIEIVRDRRAELELVL